MANFAGQRIAVSAILVRVCENSCVIPPTEMSCPAVSSITPASDERPTGSAGRKRRSLMELFLGGVPAVSVILGFYLWKSISRLYWSTRASIRERR